jgi:pimeloyl-ACP methyl ester carboxylesterase
MRARWVVLVVVLVAGVAPARAASAVTCPEGAKCGTVRVPVDPANPSSGSLAIAYQLHAHTGRGARAAGTLVPITGGPGESNTAFPERWQQLYGPLLKRFDLLLVDNRGTGQSALIDCKPLQHGVTAENVRACAEQIGPRRDYFRSASVARDLDAVRAALGIDKIDLYGFSWGSVQARAYAARFGDHLRSLVLDSSGLNLDVVRRASERSLLYHEQVALLCGRSVTCRAAGGDPLAQVAALVETVRRDPVTGTAYDFEGGRQNLSVDETLLWNVFTGPPLAQLPGAAQALGRGDKRPLLRLVAENQFFPATTDSGDSAQFSIGDTLAVLCNEQRFPWDWSAPPATRRAQYDAAFAALPAGSFGLFSASAVSGDPAAVERSCFDWPAPASTEPPVPDGTSYPAVPALVINGDLDSAVPAVARAYASQFPTSTYVEFANVGHGVAFSGPCAATILRRFVSRLAPGDTQCVKGAPPVFGYSLFPRRAGDVTTRVRRLRADGSTARDRLAAAATAETLIDAAVHGSGHGLRGGRCAATPDSKLLLLRCRFVEDVAVSGVGSVDPAASTVAADVRIAGPGTSPGRLRIQPRGRDLAVNGQLGGRRVRLLVSVRN